MTFFLAIEMLTKLDSIQKLFLYKTLEIFALAKDDVLKNVMKSLLACTFLAKDVFFLPTCNVQLCTYEIECGWLGHFIPEERFNKTFLTCKF